MNKAKFISDVPEDRANIIESIKTKKPRIIFVMGDVDTGKSTLVAYLANNLLHEFKIAIIDADIGQKSILPPATISLAFPERRFGSFSELTPKKSYFIGSTTPNQFFGEAVVGLKRLVDLALRRAEIVVVDLTGYVRGAGEELKRLKIEAIHPDMILALQREGELENILAPFKDRIEIINAEISEKVKRYDLKQRKKIRQEKWEKYFENSKIYTINLNDYRISGTRLFKGKVLGEEEIELLRKLFGWVILYGEKNDKYVVVKGGPGQRRDMIHAIDFEKFSNLLVGFIDGEGFCPGVGILKWISFRERKAEILTPLKEEELGQVKEIRFGRIKVKEDGEELGLLGRDAI
ncbi:Clp1/GlmU family protein [Palaeococcus sp. (in: euryarchaeotes)]